MVLSALELIFDGKDYLHCSTIFKEKGHTVLSAITSCVMESGVLILVQSIHFGSSLKENLSALHLKGCQDSVSQVLEKAP